MRGSKALNSTLASHRRGTGCTVSINCCGSGAGVRFSRTAWSFSSNFRSVAAAGYCRVSWTLSSTAAQCLQFTRTGQLHRASTSNSVLLADSRRVMVWR
ncbi:hypothetical protein D3C85_1340160 [compost metagenome]